MWDLCNEIKETSTICNSKKTTLWLHCLTATGVGCNKNELKWFLHKLN